MAVLITGGAGFIGSSCAVALLQRGIRPIIVDSFDETLYPREHKRANLDWVSKFGSFELYESDIRDRARMASVFGAHSIDGVVHLAALAGVRHSLKSGPLYQDVNVTGTAQVLETARAAGVRRFVLASSSSVYGDGPAPFVEDVSADRPLSPYAASKRAMECVAQAYQSSFGLDITCLRFFSVYGPRQRPDMAIRRFLELVREGRALPLYGDLESGRDYTFVEDVVSAVTVALERANGYHLYNLGREEPVTLAELVATITAVTGIEPKLERHPRQPGDSPLTCASIERARRELDYRPRVGLREGIERTWAWILARENRS